MKKVFLIVSVLFSGLILCGQTHQVITTSGGTGQASETIVNWSLGEPVINTLTKDDVILTQGFHQPFLKITAIKVSDNIPFNINVFPNPTHELLLIHLQDSDTEGFHYLLYDINGKVLAQNKFESNMMAVNMDNYPAGIYLLKVMQREKEIKTFEIIKK